VHPSGLTGCVGQSQGLACFGAVKAVDLTAPAEEAGTKAIEPAEEAGTKAISRGVLLPETENQR
jgi:hypothetical protein